MDEQKNPTTENTEGRSALDDLIQPSTASEAILNPTAKKASKAENKSSAKEEKVEPEKNEEVVETTVADEPVSEETTAHKSILDDFIGPVESEEKEETQAPVAAVNTSNNTTKKTTEEQQNNTNKNTSNISLEYKPISAWGYVGYQILFSIPVIGWLILLVFALGGTKRINVKNYARSFFCSLLISIIFLTILGVTIGVLYATMGEEMVNDFVKFLEEAAKNIKQ